MLKASVRAAGYSSEEFTRFWDYFLGKTACERIPQRTLVMADLARIVRYYRDVGHHQWLASVRRVRPYFVAFLRTKRDARYASLIGDLMRHSDFRVTVCKDIESRGEVQQCVSEALAALDPDSLLEVRYSPARREVLWVEFGDGLSGFVDWSDMDLDEAMKSLVPESATVGGRGKTVELTTKNGDLFEIDAASVRALLDEQFARQISIRARRSDEAVGQRIGDARKAAGLTQTALGERAGLDQAVISRLEGGAHQPRVDTLQRIAAALDMSLSALLSERSV
ncbi:MAG: helix-turn-helix transcriptional regulator [Acidobacteriota bacterium]